MEVAIGVLGISPIDFWKSTPKEILSGLKGKYPDTNGENGSLSKQIKKEKEEDKARVLSFCDEIEEKLRQQGRM